MLLPPEILFYILQMMRGSKTCLPFLHTSRHFYYIVREDERKEIIYECRLLNYFHNRWFGFDTNSYDMNRLTRNYSDIPIYSFVRGILKKENPGEYLRCCRTQKITLDIIDSVLNLNYNTDMDIVIIKNR